MASIQAVTKARILQQGMKGFFGVEPALDIQPQYVRVFYPADKLKVAQTNFSNKMTAPPGELRPEIQQIITPYLLKKIALPAFGLFAFGYLLGKVL